MITINKLSIHFTGEYLFNDVSFIINKKDRIGLVGKNGAGKTTLLKIIVGEIEPEKGSVINAGGLSIGFLPQEKITGKNNNTVFDEALTSFSEIFELEAKITNYTSEISRRTDYESSGYLKLLNQLNEANERFDFIGGNTIQVDTEKILLGLGFSSDEFTKPVNEFSGGWQMRIELAKILLQKPNLILLDEPTNHLDIESIQWLEEFLINYPGAVVLVSHDRAFLDNITKRTIEISLGKIYDFSAGYSDYVILRQEQRENQIATFSNQQKEIADIEKFINRFRYKESKARQVQSRVKRLNKIDKIEIDDVDSSAIHFKFPPAPRSGKVVFEAENLSKNYGDKLVLKDLNFAVLKNDFIAFVGKNGEGKTTLSRIIVNELEHHGKANLGFNVEIGYYAQNQTELLDQNKTVFQTIDDVAVGDIRSRIRSILGSFLFSGETIDKKVKVLSGGEKSRLALAKLLLSPVNLLVLDEPTNHLDMPSKDILKNALLRYDGALIIVSHDRDFLQGLTNKVFEFKNQKIREYIGDIYDFLESRKIENLKELEINSAKATNKQDIPMSDNKIQWERKKEVEKEIRKTSNQINKSEKTIEELEEKIQHIDSLLAEPHKIPEENDFNEIFQNYKELKNNIEEEMKNWEALNLKLEKLKG
ncbi:MAG: ABC-F family ATP-binding cassette domain-containing protein [Saprospiraceae bacterium]|nr:ABC-F family ATP-binding cassette domain-containing protein [Saprospiraceae bacterium]